MAVRYPRIVFFGDSIAAIAFRKGGYGAEMVSQYMGTMDVISRGFPGYNSTQILDVLVKHNAYLEADGPEPKLWILHAGTNDSCTEGLQRVPLETFLANMRSMIGLIRERYPTSGLIVITPAQCDNDAWMSWLRKLGYPPDQGLLHIHDNQVTRLYAKSVVQLCAELGVPCVDAFDAFEDTIRLGHTLADLLYDGLHYTPAGHQAIAARFFPLIRQNFPQLDPVTCEPPYPLFAEYGYESNTEARAFMARFMALPNGDKGGSKLLEMERVALQKRGYGRNLLP